MNNKFSQQQLRGRLTKSNHALTIACFRKSFASEFCNITNATGFRKRLILEIGIGLGVRPTASYNLLVNQFKKERINRADGIVFYPKVGSLDGESKNLKGGINAVRYPTRCILMHDVEFFNGTLNIYCLILDYFAARAALTSHATDFS